MTDPLGRYWEQPDRSEISFSLSHAHMTKQAFDLLKDYSHTKPTGAYPGKMWKCRDRRGRWNLCFYGDKFMKDDKEFVNTYYSWYRISVTNQPIGLLPFIHPIYNESKAA